MHAVGWLSLGGYSANVSMGKMMHLCGVGGKKKKNQTFRRQNSEEEEYFSERSVIIMYPTKCF